MTVSYWQDQPRIKQTLGCDFLIVGGGIAGLSLSYWLEKLHPEAKITIVDRGLIGNGASSRNGGFITCGSIEHFARLSETHGEKQAAAIWKFSDDNRELLKEHVIENNDKEVQFSQPGTSTLAIDSVQAARFETAANAMTAQGIGVQSLNGKEIEAQYHLKNYRSGVRFCKDGQIHPALLLQHLRKKLKAEILENQEVISLDENQTLTTHFKIKAQHVFLTLNSYLPLLAPEFAKYITPQRGQALVTQPLPQRIFGPVYITHHLAYLRQLIDGELLIGGFRTSNPVPADEETYADCVTPEIQSALENYLEKHFGKIEVQYRWSGTMGFSLDHQMLIGHHPTRRNLSLMAGCSGHGMGLSFHAAKVLAESVSGKSIPAHLNVSRFSIA